MAETNHPNPMKPSSGTANIEANEGIEIVSSLFPTNITRTTAAGDEHEFEDPENIHVKDTQVQRGGSQPDVNKPKWKWSVTTTFLVCLVIFGAVAAVVASISSSSLFTKINASASTNLNKTKQGKSTKVPSTSSSAGKASKSLAPSLSKSLAPSLSVVPSLTPSAKPSVFSGCHYVNINGDSYDVYFKNIEKADEGKTIGYAKVNSGDCTNIQLDKYRSETSIKVDYTFNNGGFFNLVWDSVTGISGWFDSALTRGGPCLCSPS
jgi:hypothetical protein